MQRPMVVKGIAPQNVLEVKELATAVLLIMRRPAEVRQRGSKVAWFVWCQVEVGPHEMGLPHERTVLVSVPAFPARHFEAEPAFVADELPLAPLPAYPRAVALAFYPLPVISWRFEFFTDQQQHPDATAEAWAFPIRANHADCGLFQAPHRAGR